LQFLAAAHSTRRVRWEMSSQTGSSRIGIEFRSYFDILLDYFVNVMATARLNCRRVDLASLAIQQASAKKSRILKSDALIVSSLGLAACKANLEALPNLLPVIVAEFADGRSTEQLPAAFS